MLTAKLKTCIETAQGMGMGTRDDNLVPDFSRVLGAKAIDDDHLRIFIDAPTSTTTLNNLKLNQVMSVVIVDIFNAESYQFKGKFISLANVTAEEQVFVDDYLERFNEGGIALGLNPNIVFNYPHTEMLGITMEVQEIFEQTPKKGTGQKMQS